MEINNLVTSTDWLNDAGVESVEVIKGPASCCMVQMLGWCFVFQPRKICGCTYFKPILIKIILKYARKRH
jgi:hypothetical protein